MDSTIRGETPLSVFGCVLAYGLLLLGGGFVWLGGLHRFPQHSTHIKYLQSLINNQRILHLIGLMHCNFDVNTVLPSIYLLSNIRLIRLHLLLTPPVPQLLVPHIFPGNMGFQHCCLSLHLIFGFLRGALHPSGSTCPKDGYNFSLMTL